MSEKDNEVSMDPEQTPRHSRQGSVPVTIDLTAERDEATQAAEGAETDATEPKADAAPDSEPLGVSESHESLKADAATTPAGPAPERRAGGSLVSGFIGGVIVLAGVAGLQVAGIWPATKPDPVLLETNKTLAIGLADLQARLDALPKVVAPDPDLAKRLSDLEAKLAAIPVSSTSDPAKIAALSDEVVALKTQLAQAQDDAAKALAGVELRVAAAEKKMSEPRDDIEVARAIASAGLKAAIDRGGPFMAELETLANVIPDDPAVKELRAFAATGVPSRTELMAAFPDAANEILGALAVSDPDQSMWDRLTASAWSLVKVRPVGNVEGEGPDAVVARIEEKLQNGDLKGASLEFDTLPDAGKTAGAAFQAKLDARLRVEELVGGTLDRAVSGTAKAG